MITVILGQPRDKVTITVFISYLCEQVAVVICPPVSITPANILWLCLGSTLTIWLWNVRDLLPLPIAREKPIISLYFVTFWNMTQSYASLWILWCENYLYVSKQISLVHLLQTLYIQDNLQHIDNHLVYSLHDVDYQNPPQDQNLLLDNHQNNQDKHSQGQLQGLLLSLGLEL